MFDHFVPPPATAAEPLARLVDVTLRDGGFEVDFHWPPELFARIPGVLAPLGVETVELGYLGGVPLEHAVTAAGVAAHLTPGHVAAARQPGVELAAMLHPTAQRVWRPGSACAPHERVYPQPGRRQPAARLVVLVD